MVIGELMAKVAVGNAIGCPIKELPITPERVLQLISQEKKDHKQ